VGEYFWFTRDDEWNGEGTPILWFSHGFLSRKSTALYVHTVPGTDSNRFIKILLGDDLAGLFFGCLVRQDVRKKNGGAERDLSSPLSRVYLQQVPLAYHAC
jgi:hypothetical protein